LAITKENMKKNKNKQQSESIERDDRIQFEGHVEEALPGTWFKVLLHDTPDPVHVLATISGKLRQNHIHILPGDVVMVEMSPYDPSRGRIVWRK